MAMISALWTRRSISETTQAALGMTCDLSENGRLVVTITADFSTRSADRPNARGMSIDAEDNLYLTEVEHRAVGIIPARDRTY